jgi:predicted alpha/beta superfamily hydrolase
LATDPATGLELQLKDFASEALIENPDTMNHRVFISSSTLYDFLTRAEAKEKLVKERKGKMVQLESGARKRRRQKTPPEELKSDDERRFLEEEERVAKRMARWDGDYVESSPSSDEQG